MQAGITDHVWSLKEIVNLIPGEKPLTKENCES
jgi:hypothetical protein